MVNIGSPKGSVTVWHSVNSSKVLSSNKLVPISQLCSRCFGLALPYWTEEELGDVYYIIDLLAPVYYYFITKEL